MEISFDPLHFAKPAFPLGNRLRRGVWNLIWACLFRHSPRPMHSWRRLLLRAFGAEIGEGSHIYPKALVWAPWNLRMGKGACIGDGAEVYNPSLIDIGDYAIISQQAYLCGASHDYKSWDFPLISQHITIGAHAWIAARAIVCTGIRIGEGCVIGAGSVVTRNMPEWSVCAGNPCKVIKNYRKV